MRKVWTWARSLVRRAYFRLGRPLLNQMRYEQAQECAVYWQARSAQGAPLGQAPPDVYPELEYVVFDACSDDGTGDILRKYADALDVLVVEKDKGQSDALNRASRLVRGDILGYLNADDCLASPRTVAEVVARFAEHPEAD